MKVGDRVRVIESVIVYHHPEHRNQPFDLKGSDGEIASILEDWQGRPISPNLPVVVKFRQFKKPLTAHFRPEELECLPE
ncbi:MAG TPA: ferredoxin-thioredoxin reductase variable chain [Oscillatoriales cyanobacterium M59_W2019_021]|nr:ferredoxin-thioredoxin reductase variable chain [Oscillatoriales cyanobacterium M4454_W2019_049]HIK53497.1 ferredoxin-thioredoxin reductase variable chain [Oscillatoriales cyanobacterium M59_W2019_021]